MSSRSINSLLVAFALVSATGRAASSNTAPDGRADVTIQNWDAPAKWTAPAEPRDPKAVEQDAEAAATQSLRAARQPLIIINPTPLTFTPIAPCRVADTRGNGFTGLYGPPSMAGGASRNFTITGQCGIPAGALAVSFNFTVWNTLSYGDLRVYPTGGTVAAVSTLNWNPGMLALANAAVVQLGTGGNAGSITTVNESGSPIDLFIDVNGYYGPTGSLPNGVARTTANVSATSFYLYPVAVNLPTGGVCLVTSQAQITYTGSPTSANLYLRIALNRGSGDTDDGLFGHYFGALPGASGKSVDLNRTAVIPVNPSQSTQFGCFVGNVDSGDQTGNLSLDCHTTYVCF